MNNDFSFVAYSHSTYSDLWEPFFDRLKQHLPIQFSKYYLFVDEIPENMKEIVPDNFELVQYNNDDSYTNRLRNCFEKVETKYCLFHHEDMILSGDVDVEIMNQYASLMEEEEIDYIKLLKGGHPKDTAYDNRHSKVRSLCKITNDFLYIVAVQPSLWNVNTFREIVTNVPDLNIWQFETNVNEFCKTQNYKYYYSFVGNERRRGMYHWDCGVYPAICTAIYKGKWTVAEYYPELFQIFRTYGIDPNIRGSV